jgi:tetratricopeptide (TPR) repeat protein
MELLDRVIRKKKAERKYREGLEFHKKELYNEAEVAYKEAIRIDPGFYKAYVNIGTATLENLKNPGDGESLSKAEHFFNKALGLKPDNAISLFNLGTMYYMHYGKEEKAFDYFAQAINADPLFMQQVKQYLGWASYTQREDFKKVVDRSIYFVTQKKIRDSAAISRTKPDSVTEHHLGENFEWYYSQRYKFSLKILKGWNNRATTISAGMGNEVLVALRNSEGAAFNIIVGPQPYGKTASVIDLEKQARFHVQNVSGELKAVKHRKIAGKIEAVEIDYIAFMMRYKKIAFLKNDQEYLMTFSAHPHLYSTYEPLFTEVVDSIHFSD